MACGACSGRRQGRIIPVKPSQSQKKTDNTNGAQTQGKTLRDRLRYTGR